jgi:hypothetical protein
VRGRLGPESVVVGAAAAAVAVGWAVAVVVGSTDGVVELAGGVTGVVDGGVVGGGDEDVELVAGGLEGVVDPNGFVY